MPVAGSRKFVEQRFCFFEIGRVETFGEPAVDRREEVAGFGVAALVAAEPGEARSGAQLPELSLLLLGDVQGFAIQFLGGLGLPLPLQQLAFVPVQLRCEPALPCPFDDLKGIVNKDRVKPPSTCPAISHALARRAIKWGIQISAPVER